MSKYKNILITGASTGIGEELALRYGKKAESIHLIARSCDKLQLLKENIQNLNNEIQVHIYCIDLSDLETTSALSFRLSKLNILFDLIILNAGISLGHQKTKFTSLAEFQALFNVNFMSNHALLEHLIFNIQHAKYQSEKKKIVFISSLASLITMPSSIAYSTSKRALNAYSEGLTYFLHKNNTEVINILPGFIKTPLTDKNSFKMPFLMSLENGVNRIEKAIEKNINYLVFPKRFYFFILLIKLLPIKIRKKILHKFFNPSDIL
jgi:short-subunit dehydrogenase